ncbi:MAG: hypothetical protein PHT54_01960 [Candidatus Nanoarchaeia archaeon]|nr:hypothetical protein [Candidatus Nanoarchaeia archaeon]
MKISRRAFLELGTAVVADVAFELSGGTGLVKQVSRWIDDPVLIPKLPPVIKNPKYNFGEFLNDKIKPFFVPYLKSVLNGFSAYNPIDEDALADQVVFLENEYDIKLIDNGQCQIKSRIGQALLLPFDSEKKRYFFATANHCVRDFYKNRPHFYFDKDSLILPIDILVYSNDCDLAFGWAVSADKINVKNISISRDHELWDTATIVPSSSLKETQREIVEGDLVDFNDSYLDMDASEMRGYSGSPILVNDQLAGILVVGVEILPDKKNYARGISARHLEGMLKFYVDSCEK